MMWVREIINSHELIVLIDSGSTYNFISEKVANTLQLPMKPTEPFSVRVANGGSLTCQGRLKNVPIHLQGILFSLIIYALPLYGLDLLLGIQWLE